MKKYTVTCGCGSTVYKEVRCDSLEEVRKTVEEEVNMYNQNFRFIYNQDGTSVLIKDENNRWIGTIITVLEES